MKPSKKTKNSSLPETLKDRTCVYQGPRISVYSDNHYDVVVHPGAVVILPLIDPMNIVMIKNYRVAIDKTLWELPAGTLEPGELPIDTAKRELQEETGYRPKQIRPLFEFFTTPGFCNEKIYAFFADNLELIEQKLDPNEKIEVQIVTWTKAHEMIANGEICDAKTIATLLYYTVF